MVRMFCSLLVVVLCLGTVKVNAKEVIKDAESASHDSRASDYQIVNKYKFDDCELIQFNLSVLSHYSYILASDDKALLVDPGRDIDAYMEYVKKNELELTGVFLTHSHADFVAGHIEAVKNTGLPIYISHAANAGYKHTAIKDNDSIKVGKVSIRFMETPGHTLDGVCALVVSDGKPQFLFTGDTLFVGSVGRPDLMGGTISAAELAEKSYQSWHDKLSKLPDDLKFFPAHGAGSLCGAHLRDEPFSTIGREKKDNDYLQAKSRSEFVAKILDGLPEAPQYFKYDAAMNRKGPELVEWDAPVKYVQVNAAIINPKDFFVIDVRDAKTYAGGHLPNSVNIALRGRFETWVGTMAAPEDKLILAGDTENELKEGIWRLHRIGYRAQGILYSAAAKAGLESRKSGLANPAELYKKMQAGTAPLVVDVRLPNEWAGVRVGSIVNLPLNHLAESSSKLNKKEPVVTVCNSAYRSSMAVGILERNGFADVSSVDGGTEAWVNAGLPVYRGTDGKGTSQAVESTTRKLPLPDRIGATELQMMIRDLPGSFELIDIRPAADFKEYTIAGAKNVDIADAINSTALRSGQTPLVIIDRDGTVAMALGGILARESNRQVKVLLGGLESYWRAFGTTRSASEPIANSPAMKVQPAVNPAPVSPVAPAKKQSPGC